MLRRIHAAALALVVAGGVYLAAGTAEASNMGFKLERDFATYPTWTANYWMSFPLFNGLGDVANSPSPANDKCDLAAAGGSGDGVINLDDALCDLFTDRGLITGGQMTIQRLATRTCTFEGRQLRKSVLGGIQFLGNNLGTDMDGNTVPDWDDSRDLGFLVQPLVSTGQPNVTNRSVIVGSHDPSFTGHTISLGPAACLADFIHLPYHTMYQNALEILCGLRGTDWDDADGNGTPDTCPNGIFDPVTGVRVVVQTNVNEPTPPAPFGRGFNGVSMDRNPLTMQLRRLGTDYPLKPGDGYIVSLVPGFTGSRNYLSPHF